MNRPPDPQRDALLSDVLAEAEPADFRAALLGETLRLARRRRHVRLAMRTAAVAFPLVALGLFAWRGSQNEPPVPPASDVKIAAAPTGHTLVSTYPLSPDAIVRTQPLDPARTVATFASVATIRTPGTDLALRLIDDAELLALAAPRPAALVRLGPQTQELIFADTEDSPPDSR